MSAVQRFRERLGAHPRLQLVLAAVALALALAASVRLAVTPTAPEAARRQFLAAGRAYEAGRMREAARLYEDLVRAGHTSAEVFFNLGNAEARDGRLGAAVLNYRKAWRLAPRDPDIDANLRLVLQAGGASEADLSGGEIIFTRLSEREWAVTAVAAWWAACLFVCLAGLVRGRRRLMFCLAALPAAVAVAAVLGLGTWRQFELRPELVVLSDTLNALRSPEPAAAPQFSLPEGSLVRERERRGAWVRVSYGQLSGWIRREACAPVLLSAPPK